MTYDVVGVRIAVMTDRDRNLATPGSLGQRPQDTFLQSKSVGSKFITHSKCLKQPVAQKWGCGEVRE